jgi:hypothetical protein
MTSKDNQSFSDFPLYNMLLEHVNSMVNVSALTTEQADKIMQTLRTLDHVNQVNLFIVIKIFSLKNTESNLLDIPYQGQKTDNTKFTFNLKKFPLKLQHMISKFCDIYTSKPVRQ